jgi:hypothetical protein
MRYWTVVMIISAFLLGVATQGLFFFQAGIVEIVGVSGTVIILWKAVTDLLKENVFQYSGIYKKDEIRIDYEKRGWGQIVEKERHNETAYYLRITKKKGAGRLEECEGFLSFSNRKHVPTVWEGPNYQKIRSISLQDDLRLFNISEDKKEILILRKPDNIDTNMPYAMFTTDIEEVLDTKLSVRLGSKSGNIPDKPFEKTIRQIIDSAIQD